MLALFLTIFMKQYTVKQLAKLSGVTVRALHHYDEIGLLKPSHRTDAGYRLYEEKDLMRLQQILIYREMDFALEDVKQILDDPDFDLAASLHDQKQYLLQQQERYQQLIKTIDKTLSKITGDELVTDAELYEGISPEDRERWDREAKEQYGDMYEMSQKKVRQMTKSQWAAVKELAAEVNRGMIALQGRDPTDPEVQAVIAKHHAWIETFYPCSAEIYRGLSNLYVEHPEFRAHYDQQSAGLAEFMSAAMKVYAERILAKKR